MGCLTIERVGFLAFRLGAVVVLYDMLRLVGRLDIDLLPIFVEDDPLLSLLRDDGLDLGMVEVLLALQDPDLDLLAQL